MVFQPRLADCSSERSHSQRWACVRRPTTLPAAQMSLLGPGEHAGPAPGTGPGNAEQTSLFQAPGFWLAGNTAQL